MERRANLGGDYHQIVRSMDSSRSSSEASQKSADMYFQPASVRIVTITPSSISSAILRATWIAAPHDCARYGHDLYANLRRLDASGARRILVETPPDTPEWEAVNDRLGRAAAGAGALGDEP